MKIGPVGAEFFREDGRTDRNDRTNSHFSQLCERTCKIHCTDGEAPNCLQLVLHISAILGRYQETSSKY